MSNSSVLLVDCGVAKSWTRSRYEYDKSLGVLSCHGYLQKNGITSKLVFPDDIRASLPFSFAETESFTRSTAQEQPDFIGFSCTSDTLPIGLYLAEEIKKKQRSRMSRIVFGGIGPSSYPALLLHHYPFVDGVIMGEGERSLFELVSTGPDVGGWDRVAGIAYRGRDGKVRTNAARERIENLDEVPVQYARFHYVIPQTGEKISSYSMVTSRGCTGHCLFCSHSLMWQRHISSHSVSSILAVAEKIIRTSPDTHIAFQDDDFLHSTQRVKSFCQQINTGKHPFKWEIFGRLERINDEILSCLQDSGCSSITFGLDAVVEKGRSALGKSLSFNEALSSLARVKNHIPTIFVNMIYGWGGETEAQFDQLIKEAYALKLEGFSIKIAPLTIYPGTPIHRQLSRKRKLIPNESLFRPLLGEAFRYVTGHEALYPHLCANSFDKFAQRKKDKLRLLEDTFTIYSEI